MTRPWLCKVARVLALVGLASCVTSAPMAATLGPHAIHPVPQGSWPDAVGIGDFNGDGRRDVVLATTMYDAYSDSPDIDWSLFLYLQTAQGTLGVPVQVKYSSRNEEGDDQIGFRTATGLAVADLDADGIDDIVVGRRKGLSLVRGTRTGQYIVQRVANTTGASSGDAIAILDADGDGRPDIATHNDTGGDAKWGITVYFADVSGTFFRQRLLPTDSEGGMTLVVGDMDGDRIPDLVLSWLQGHGNGVQFFHGDGHGWFRVGRHIGPQGLMMATWVMAVGDFAWGDGLDDLVVGGPGGGIDRGVMYLLPQLTPGEFGDAELLEVEGLYNAADIPPDAALAYDFDRDQRKDLILLRSGGSLGYFEHVNGRLAPEIEVPGAYMTWGGNQPLAAGDIDGDGCSDLAVANYNYGLVVWRGAGCKRKLHGARPMRPPVLPAAGTQGVRPAPPPAPRPVRRDAPVPSPEPVRRGSSQAWQ